MSTLIVKICIAAMIAIALHSMIAPSFSTLSSTLTQATNAAAGWR